MKLLNLIGPTSAWLRHVGTAAGAVIAVLGVLAGLTPDQQSALIAAWKAAFGGAADMVTALGVIATVVMAVWARWTAKPAQQVAAVNALPNATVVAVDPSQPLTAPAPAKVSASPWAVLLGLALLAPVLLGGCTAAPSVGTTTAAGGTNQAVAPGVSAQAQSAANTINATYAIVKGAVNVYIATCGSTSSDVCSPAVVAQLTKALTVTDAAVVQAVNALLTPTTDPTSVPSLLNDAMGAITVLTQAAATFGLAAL